MPYEHLRFGREIPLTDRHRRRRPGVRPPEDPRRHGEILRRSLDSAFERAIQQDVRGFDDRQLIKILLRIRTTRLDYRMSKLWFTLVTALDLNEVERAFQRNREEGMGERNVNRSISNSDRKSGTLQVSRWNFKLPVRNSERLFIVVTRQDTVWATGADDPEPYALVAVLEDRENTAVNLYAQVRTQLEVRAQARARARV
jgi:hypothetical protein